MISLCCFVMWILLQWKFAKRCCITQWLSVQTAWVQNTGHSPDLLAWWSGNESSHLRAHTVPVLCRHSLSPDCCAIYSEGVAFSVNDYFVLIKNVGVRRVLT